MYKTKFFHEKSMYDLEDKVNAFIQDKRVVNISYTTNSVGYNVYHYCCVLYME